ncbi:MAG: A/G-specific adenine glycosylase [Crocinitomicaceae bacterium]|nr:A/G-specific adenine glycosylase [Crocinitomicaceae bacterium]
MGDFSTLIKNWYRQNARELPWRSTSDPYAIWLSEIILQQTRVDQGMDYYLKFLDHYPDIQSLANATEDQVLNDWQGLGYYSRARNLHASAKYVVNELNGKFPTEYGSVLSLKGVGAYTAAAICSFAYDHPHAVVDGNVYRVLARLDNCEMPIDSGKGQKYFQRLAEELLDENDPAVHNQAIMELGALICTPKNPDCENCPVNEICISRINGTQLDLPVKEKKTKVRNRYFHYLIWRSNEQVAIRKRTGKDIWQGLYEFHLIEVENEKDQPNFPLQGDQKVMLDGEYQHILSHQRIHAKFWVIDTLDLPKVNDLMHIKIEQLDDYPMPQLLIRYLTSSKVFMVD